MKYFQLVGKKRGLLSIVFLALSLSIASLNAVSPEEQVVWNYLICLLNKTNKDAFRPFCQKMICLLQATNNPKFQPLIEAFREVLGRNNKNMLDAKWILERLEKAGVLNLIPEELKHQAKIGSRTELYNMLRSMPTQ